MNMRLSVLFFVAMAVIACDRPTTPTTPIDTNFVLAPGEARVVEDTTTEIRFNGVTNDSRCPADVVCITGGDAHVQIRVASGLGTREYVLHTGDMKPVTHDDLTIHLVQVTPYPFSSRTIAPDDYRVTLRVTR
jgi:hypothetical protein